MSRAASSLGKIGLRSPGLEPPHRSDPRADALAGHRSSGRHLLPAPQQAVVDALTDDVRRPY